MSTVAQQLRQAREAQHLTVYQVAEVTKIRTDHLRALEEGNFDVFSAPVYIRGFVRACATLLKLDVPQIMAALDAELEGDGKIQRAAAAVGPAAHPTGFLMFQLSKVNWNKGLVVLCAVMGIAIVASVFAIWRHAKASDPLADLKPAVYQPAQNNSGEMLPLPPPKK